MFCRKDEVIFWVTTQTLIPICRPLKPRFATAQVRLFTSFEAAQSSRIMSVLVPAKKNFTKLSQSSTSCCSHSITNILRSFSPIRKKGLLKMLDFCLSTTNFKYNNTYYQKIFGTAMGSPVSAVMANLVLEDLEKRALSTSIAQPCFWKRYVMG